MLQSDQLELSLERAVGFSPMRSSSASGWRNAALYNWKGDLGELTLDTHDAPVLSLHIGGVSQARVRIGATWFETRSRPGLLTFVPPRESVKCDVAGKIRSITVHFDPECFVEAGRGAQLACEAGGLRAKCGFQDDLLSAAVRALAEEVENPSGIGSLYADSIALGAVLRLVRIAGRGADDAGRGLSKRALRQSLELIESSIENGISLETLAKATNLCRTHFAKAFRRSAGVTPHRYLTLRRIELAKNLLANSKDSISQIAVRCGFSSQTHFSQYFRMYSGHTPFAFRLGGSGSAED